MNVIGGPGWSVIYGESKRVIKPDCISGVYLVYK